MTPDSADCKLPYTRPQSSKTERLLLVLIVDLPELPNRCQEEAHCEYTHIGQPERKLLPGPKVAFSRQSRGRLCHGWRDSSVWPRSETFACRRTSNRTEASVKSSWGKTDNDDNCKNHFYQWGLLWTHYWETEQLFAEYIFDECMIARLRAVIDHHKSIEPLRACHVTRSWTTPTPKQGCVSTYR